jgi:predicted phage-related endonuclease
MKEITLVPGSPEWIKSRSASKAAAMMGVDPKTTQAELVKMMATGVGKVFTDWQQRMLLDKGNASEAGTRDIAEEVLGDGLSPACASTDDGYLTAAPDGVTFSGKVGFEAKAWNEELVADIKAGKLKPERYWQLEQQCFVFNLDYILFCSSNGTPDKFVCMEYYPVPGRAEQLLAGWKMLDEKIAEYRHTEVAAEVVASPVPDLPVLFVQAKGEVTDTNMPWFKACVTQFIAGLNLKPTNDQEYADGKAIASKLRAGAKALQVKKAEMLAQTATIGEVAADCDAISKQMNAAALTLEKAVETEEANRKGRLIQGGKDQLSEHVKALSDRIGISLPAFPFDFAAAIKGKSKFESMQNGIDAELTRAKLVACELADKIEANLKLLDASSEYGFLFSDRHLLVTADKAFVELTIESRVARHKVEHQKKLDAEREKIRLEEEARAEAKLKAETERLAAEAESERLEKAIEAARMAAPLKFSSDIPPVASSPVVVVPAGRFRADQSIPLELFPLVEAVASSPVVEYAPASENELTQSVSLRVWIAKAINDMSIDELEVVRSSVEFVFSSRQSA